MAQRTGFSVGVGVDATSGYGRDVLLGVLRYSNIKRSWRLFEDLQVTLSRPQHWPQCDGIITTLWPAERLDEMARLCRQLVCCSGNAPAAQPAVVCLNDIAAGRAAAEHLLQCRRRNFGFVGSPGSPASDNRIKGFEQVLAAQGLWCRRAPVEWRWRGVPYGRTPAERAPLLAWLHSLPKPVGIMALDDMVARDVARACLEGGIAVPDEVSIVGVNNDQLLCQSAWPTLTSVDAGATRIGFAAARLLDLLLQGQEVPEDQRQVRLLPLGVIRRKSTEVLASDNPFVAAAVRYIHAHACDPCTVGDVLRHVPVNRRWLERQFAARPDLHGTPHDEIIHTRLETAKRMLAQQEFSLDEIARACGFATTGSFSRAFSQRVGETPGAYRRQRQGSAADTPPEASHDDSFPIDPV